jgi:hypothetical protein
MKVETRIFGALTIFFAVVAAAYTLLSLEPVGSAALIFTTFLAMLIWFFLWYTGRQIDPRPEDNDTGEIVEMAGEYGFFGPHSWWPLVLAAGAALTALGVIFGWWLFLIGFGVVLGSTVGLVFEYYRGPFAEEPH